MLMEPPLERPIREYEIADRRYLHAMPHALLMQVCMRYAAEGAGAVAHEDAITRTHSPDC